MEIAKSLYLGGKLVRASDKNLSYSSYRQLGLRCCFCGEPVHLRSGQMRISHFAHFPNISSSKLEECTLKRANCNNSFTSNWYDLIEGRNQRLEAFQKYFLNILEINVSGFKCNSALSVNFPSEIVRETLNILRTRKRAILKYIKVVRKDFSLLQRAIVAEAFDYLTRLSSKNIFEQVLTYVYFKEISGLESCSEINMLEESCTCIVQLILSIPWVSSLSSLENFSPIRADTIDRFPDFIEVLDENQGTYVYIFGNVLYYGHVKKYYFSKEIELATINSSLLRSDKFPIRQVDKPLKKSLYLTRLHEKKFIENQKYIEGLFQQIKEDFEKLKNGTLNKKKSRYVMLAKGSKDLYTKKNIQAIASTGSDLIFLEEEAVAKIEVITMGIQKYEFNSFFSPTYNYLEYLKRHPEFEETVVRLVHKLKEALRAK
jgi:hypothetical protein